MMDTLEHSKQLVAAGFTQKQAEVQTKLLNEVFVSDFATKKELKDGFDRIDAKFKEVELKFKAMDHKIDSGFKEMDLRFGEMDIRFTAISIQLKEIRQEIADRPIRDMIKFFGFSVALVTLVGGAIVIYQFVIR